jgi:hypothetical protein
MGPHELDPYWKRRTPPAIAEDMLYKCAGWPPIILKCHRSSNPITSLCCNGEIPPEWMVFSRTRAASGVLEGPA